MTNFTIKNGVRFYPLSVENNFSLADEILESGDVTSHYTADDFYNDRIENDFVGTYEISVKRDEDFDEFRLLLVREGFGKLEISYDEWKTGTKQDGKRSQRLGKWMRKQGVSQFVIDFYSQQVKDEKTFFFTVSDRVQHIIGMSYFSTMDWDGMSGSSCQDPRNEYEECNRILASARDNKLLVCFTHNSLEDLEGIEDHEETEYMTARTMAQIITVEGVQYLITTNRYGNNKSKDLMDNAIKALNGNGIFSVYDMPNPTRHREDSTGIAYDNMYDEIHVYETIDEYIEVDCPMCDGSGEYEVYIHRTDNLHEVECPACNGHGTYEANVYIEVDEWVEVEDEEEITPYAEGYNHHGHGFTILADYEHMQALDKRGQAEDEQDEQTA